MTPWLSRLLFSAVFFGALAGLHVYVWRRLIVAPALGVRARRVGAGLLALLFSATVAGLLLPRWLGPRGMGPVALTGGVWLGALLMLLVPLSALDTLSWIGRAAHRTWCRLAASASDPEPQQPADPGRRLAMSRLLAAAVAVLGAALGTTALRSGLRRVQVKRVTAVVPQLPPAWEGARVVQLTDVHVGPTLGRDFIEEIVSEVNALGPDLVVITGDLVDGSVEQLRHHVAPLAGLRSKHGTFFVTGNHEFYSGHADWCEHLGALGLQVLRNRRVSLGEAEAQIDIAGVEDFQSRHYPGAPGPDLRAALADREPGRLCILLAHQPRAVREAAELGVQLQLSGHTHGGQLWPWGKLLARLQQPVISGLARFGETLVYVSNGTGYTGTPMRLGAPAEITLIRLENGAPESPTA